MKVSGSYFKDLVAFHLKSRFGIGLEIAAIEPEKFHEGLSNLVGKYSSKILKNLIVQILVTGPSPVKVNETSFAQVVGTIKNRHLKIAEQLLVQARNP